MSDGKYGIEELRIDVRDPNVTKVYVYISADMNCPHTIQGWHYKEYPAPMSSLDIMNVFCTAQEHDPIYWDHKWPEAHEYTDLTDEFEKFFQAPLGVAYGEPLPLWASGLALGQLVLAAQLPTKDGRRMGNAVIVAIEDERYRVITDAGNELIMLESEVKEAFYPPQWIMKAEEIGKRYHGK